MTAVWCLPVAKSGAQKQSAVRCLPVALVNMVRTAMRLPTMFFCSALFGEMRVMTAVPPMAKSGVRKLSAVWCLPVALVNVVRMMLVMTAVLMSAVAVAEESGAAKSESQAQSKSVTESAADELSLSAAFLQVTNYHAAVLARQAQREAEGEGENIARAQLLPQGSAGFSNDTKTNTDWQANASVNQVLFNVPLWRQWDASRRQTQVQSWEAQGLAHDTQRQFLLAWLDAQLASDVLGLVALRQKTVREQYERTRALEAVGRVTKTDVLSAQAQLANVGAQWEQARYDLAVANEAVAIFVGQPMRQMRLTVRTEDLPVLAALPVWEDAIAAENLTLRVLDGQLDYLQKLITASEGIIFPRVEMQVGGSTGGGMEKTETFVRLNVAQSLFAGGEVAATQRQQAAQIVQTRHLRLAAARTLTQQARRFHGQLRASRAQLQSLREAVAAAQALLEAETIGYNSGVKVAVDVLRAEESVFDSRLSERQALYRYLENLVNLSALAMMMDGSFVMRLQTFFAPVDSLITLEG